MASISGNTWRFYPGDQTSGTALLAVGGMSLNWDIHPIQLAWSGFNAGDQLDLQDGQGNSVFPVGGPTAGTPFTAAANTPNPLYFQPGELFTIRGGLRLPTFTGNGVLSITLK